MKTKRLLSVLYLLLLVSLCSHAHAQPQLSTSPQTIINGKVWVPAYSITKGEQFFLSKIELTGNLKFKGKDFKHLKIFYDISKEEIITSIQTKDNTSCNIIVNPYFLEGFTVFENDKSYHFKRGDFIHEDLQPTDYYQVFTGSKLIYIVKHTKRRILNSRNNGSKTFKYIDDSRMYMIVNNKLSSIKNKTDLLNFFPQRKKKIKQFIRSEKLKINKHTPLDALPILAKFDQ
ncbi:MAG: hypothetical protein ACERIH_04565 [Labilibaculum antarcticum]